MSQNLPSKINHPFFSKNH